MRNIKQIPLGWSSPSIEDISILNPKHPADIPSTTEVSFVPMALVNDNTWKLNLEETRPLSKVRKGYTHFADGDVLMAKITPSMENGKAAIAKELKNGLGCGTTELQVIRPLGEIEPRHIYYFIHQNWFRQKAATKMTGTAGQLRVPLVYLKSHTIPLAPLNEQHRIVTKLEELFTKLDAGVQELKQARERIKQYRQSVLTHAFTGKLTEKWREEHKDQLEPSHELFRRIRHEFLKVQKSISSKREKIKVLRDIDIEVEKYNYSANKELGSLPKLWRWVESFLMFTYVTSGSRGWSQYYSDKGALFIRMGNLNHNSIKIDLSDIQRVDLPKNVEGRRTRIQAGDILISITADVGMIALVPENFEGAYINQHVALARPVPSINNKYLAWYYASNEGGKKQLKSLQRGATKVGLGLLDIRKINFPLAPLEEQEQIVNEIERHFSIADKAEEAIEQSLKQAETLRQSILKKAFEGRLVPQDPNDEPAGVLLERILVEKEKLTIDKKGKKIRRHQFFVTPAPSVVELATSVEHIQIVRIPERVVSMEDLLLVLKSFENSKATPKDLWKKSKLDIDEFYAKLKKAEIAGLIEEHRPNDKDCFLEAVK